jgi:transcriptional regulator with XRE-family HTH domain
MSSSILEAARKSRGVSQVNLARRAQTFQANISLIESGGTDPGISTIEQCLSPLGFRLIAIPTNKPSVAEFALTLGQAVKEKKFSKVFRLLIQLSDNLKAEEPEICLALCASPAPATGSAKYDALLAGVVEYTLSKRKLPVPQWVKEDSRVLAERWVVDTYARDLAAAIKATPRAFLRHNVVIDEREFESI